MNQVEPHPDESQLRGLLKGTLPASDEAAVLALLEREPAWQSALNRLVADESTWRAAAQSLVKPPLAADARLRSVLASLASIDRSHSSINTPVGGETLDSSTSDADDTSDLRFLAASSDPSYLGKLGSYLVEEVIGRGGFGVVLKSRDPELARIVAIKVLSPHLATSANACERFKREARAAAAVTHEHVITIYAVNDDPLPYLVMQYVAGQSLQEKLDREGPLGVKETLRIGMQTAAGLAAAHKQGLVHRDVKPANILLENGIERVKLTDFGLARAADDASLTRSGTIAGTPQYMSPEQARGETVDAKSDLFSLGSVLYAMLTGRSPFRADSTLAVLKRVCDDPPRPIREVNPDVPDWLAVLITRLLAKNPADRPDSAQEIADQLGHYLWQLQQPGAVARVTTPPYGPPQSAAQSPVATPVLSQPALLTKPPKLDPFADAPPTPRRSRFATVLLGLGLVVGGLTILSCLGVFASYLMHHRGSVLNAPVHTGRLIVKIPDRRLAGTLRLRKADYDNFSPGVAIATFNDQIEVVPDNTYRLKAGEYELSVRSDDVTVFSAPIRVNADGGLSIPQTFEVKPGGILSVEAESGGTYMTIELNGHEIMRNVQGRSQRMLVVPEGTIRLKSVFGSHVYAEKWLELKAGEERRVRASQESINEVSPNTAPPAVPGP